MQSTACRFNLSDFLRLLAVGTAVCGSVVVNESVCRAQEPWFDAVPYSRLNDTQKQRVAERAREQDNIRAMYDYDIAEAVSLARNMLARDLQVFDDKDQQDRSAGHFEVARSLNFLADTLYRDENFAEALEVKRLQGQIYSELFGNSSWQAQSVFWMVRVWEQTLIPDRLWARDAYGDAWNAYDYAVDHCRNNPDAALPYIRQAAATFRELHNELGIPPEENIDLAKALDIEGDCYIAKGDYRKAEELYRQAMKIFVDGGLGPNHPAYAKTLLDIGDAHMRNGEFAQAESLYREALDIFTVCYGGPHRETAHLLSFLARLYLDQGKTTLAEQTYQQAIDVYNKSDEAWPITYDTAMKGIGRIRRDLGKLDDAEKIFRDLLQFETRELGENSIAYGNCCSDLGHVLARAGKNEEALSWYTKGVLTLAHFYAPSHPEYAMASVGMGRMKFRLGKLAEAETTLTGCVGVFRTTLGDAHSETRIALDDLEWVMEAIAHEKMRAGDFAAARNAIDKIHRLRTAVMGEAHWTVSRCRALKDHVDHVEVLDADQRTEALAADKLFQSAVDLLNAKDYESAREAAEQCLATRRKLLPENSWQLAMSAYYVGTCFSYTQREDQIEPLYHEALKVFMAAIPSGDLPVEVAHAAHWLGQRHARRAEWQIAVERIDFAQNLYRNLYGRFSRLYLDSLGNLADTCVEMGNLQRGEILYREVAAARRQIDGELSETYFDTHRRLAWLLQKTNRFEDASRIYEELLRAYSANKRSIDRQYFLVRNQSAWLMSQSSEHAAAADAYREIIPRYAETISNNDLNYAVLVLNLGQVALAMEDLDTAESNLRAAKSIEASSSGTRERADWQLTKVLELRCQRFLLDRNIDGAIAVRGERLKILSERYGADHWLSVEAARQLEQVRRLSSLDESDRSRFLRALADRSQLTALVDAGQFAKALSVVERLSADAAVGDAGNWLWLELAQEKARLLASLGRIADASQLWQEIIESQVKLFDQDHPGVALLRIRGGELALTAGILEQADQMWIAARSALEKHDQRSPEYGEVLCRMAALRLTQGDLASADGALRAADEILRPVQSDYVELYCLLLVTKAELNLALGDVSQAFLISREAFKLSGRLTTKSPQTHALAARRMSLILWQEMLANQLYVDDLARAIDYANSNGAVDQASLMQMERENLLQTIKAQTEIAELLRSDSVELHAIHFGGDSLEYAAALTDSAQLLRQQGLLEQADAVLHSAAEIVQKSIGTAALPFLWVQYQQATLLATQGKLAEADVLLREVYVQREALSLQSNPQLLQLARGLGDVAIRRGEVDVAADYYWQYLIAVRRHLDAAAWIQTESQQVHLTRQMRTALDRLLSMGANATMDVDLYEHVLAFKGLAFQRQRRFREARRQTELSPAFDQWEKTTGQLATAAARIPFPEEFDFWRHHVEFLTGEKQRQEIDLLNQVRGGESAFAAAWTPATLEQLQTALAADVALIDFLEYEVLEPSINDGETTRRLTAFVVRRDQPPQRIELGVAGIDFQRDLYGWIATSQTLVDICFELPLANADRRAALAEELQRLGVAAAEASMRLKTQIWSPLTAAIGDAQTILVSPDGHLASLPLMAFPGDEQEYLIEEKSIVVIPVPGELPRLLAADVVSNTQQSALLLGGPDFSAAPQVRANPLNRFEMQDRPPIVGSSMFPSYIPLKLLKEMVPEVDNLESLIRSTGAAEVLKLVGSAGTEQMIRDHAGRFAWLHFATHGFYRRSMITSAHQNFTRLVRVGNTENADADANQGSQFPAIVDDPGLSTGLTLAGASEANSIDQDDGILWGMEVNAMDLSDVDMVVLSACETASGNIVGGEGVMSIQRDFQVAGARSIISTLWPVNDEAAMLLMRRYYVNLLKGRDGRQLNKLEALREAQLWMIKAGRQALVDQRIDPQPNESSTHISPAYQLPAIWSPFILSGDWR